MQNFKNLLISLHLPTLFLISLPFSLVAILAIQGGCDTEHQHGPSPYNDDYQCHLNEDTHDLIHLQWKLKQIKIDIRTNEQKLDELNAFLRTKFVIKDKKEQAQKEDAEVQERNKKKSTMPEGFIPKEGVSDRENFMYLQRKLKNIEMAVRTNEQKLNEIKGILNTSVIAPHRTGAKLPGNSIEGLKKDIEKQNKVNEKAAKGGNVAEKNNGK